MSKTTRKGYLGEAVDKLETTANTMNDLADGIWAIALELSQLNEKLEEMFKQIKDKGLVTRAK